MTTLAIKQTGRENFYRTFLAEESKQYAWMALTGRLTIRESDLRALRELGFEVQTEVTDGN